MPPKLDPNEVKTIFVRATGGDCPPASVLAPKVGPLGLSPKKLGDDIAKATQDWKGLKVTTKVSVQNRVATCVVIPSASSLVLKELKEPPRDKKKVKNIKHNGNLTLEQVYSVARQMRPRSQARHFSGTVKEILGTCLSVGCTVNGTSPREVVEKIDSQEIDVPSE